MTFHLKHNNLPTTNNLDQDAACTPFLYTNDVKYVCAYVTNQSSICEGGGYLSWTKYVVCQESSFTAAIIITFALIWLMFLFFILSLIAEEFFCKNIEEIVKRLKISQNIAGVTFLAFGNGAPDIFTSIASTASADRPQAGIAIADLFGSGIFTVTIVFAIITLIKPFSVRRVPMIRDICFYLIAVCFLGFIILYDTQIHLWQPIVFLVFYGFYAFIVAGGRKIFNKSNEISAIFDPPVQARSNTDASSDTVDLTFIGKVKRSYFIVQTPLTLILSLVIPCVENDWSHQDTVLHAFTAPLAFLIAFQWLNVVPISDGPVLGVYSLVFSVILSCIIIWLTKSDKEPKHYKIIVSFIGFVIAAVVIYLVASEVVNMLIMLGVILRISPEILAVTVLAWANCVGDIVADTSIARKGFQRMAISAAVGGPLFNLLIGFGVSFLLAKLQGKVVYLKVRTEMKVMLLALLSSLLLTFVLLFIEHFRFKRFHGILLIILYICFLALVVLAELKVYNF